MLWEHREGERALPWGSQEGSPGLRFVGNELPPEKVVVATEETKGAGQGGDQRSRGLDGAAGAQEDHREVTRGKSCCGFPVAGGEWQGRASSRCPGIGLLSSIRIEKDVLGTRAAAWGKSLGPRGREYECAASLWSWVTPELPGRELPCS